MRPELGTTVGFLINYFFDLFRIKLIGRLKNKIRLIGNYTIRKNLRFRSESKFVFLNSMGQKKYLQRQKKKIRCEVKYNIL